MAQLTCYKYWMVDICLKFWFSFLHECHITSGYVTCSLFHNINNGILLLLWNFRIKTEGMHLLVAEGKSLPPPTIGPLHSFQTSSVLLNLSSSSQRVQKGPWPISVHVEDAALFQPPYVRHKGSTWGLPLTWSDYYPKNWVDCWSH